MRRRDLVRSQLRPAARRLTVIAGVALAVAVLTTGAVAGRSASQPNATLGQKQFVTAGCGACHMFAAAKTKGKIGPNLDAPTLTIQQIVQQITLGGYTIMGLKAKKQYPFPMSAFKGKLSASEILNIAAFVFIDRNPKAAPGGSSGPVTYGSGGGGSSGGSGSGGSSGGSGSGGGGSGQANNGCPAGTTIQTSGATDNDDDDGGGPSDNDGCI